MTQDWERRCDELRGLPTDAALSLLNTVGGIDAGSERIDPMPEHVISDAEQMESWVRDVVGALWLVEANSKSLGWGKTSICHPAEDALFISVIRWVAEWSTDEAAKRICAEALESLDVPFTRCVE